MWVSAATTPYITVPVFILLCGARYVGGPRELLLYGGIVVGLSVLVPLGYTAHLVRKGVVEDMDVPGRFGRLGPLAAAALGSVVGLAALHVLGAPTGVLRLGMMLVALAAAVFAATAFLKISGHVTAWTAGCVTLASLWGPWALPSLLGALPIAWSRLALGRHTPLELVAGAAYGIAVSAVLAWAMGLP
jgi:membrane-associated phospholipid phosphatase